ncbi:MAG: MFS transporter [Alphaproteobacteria bacterium]|nr:MFS transporter [Alphaproteobacteria bacterium]
MQSAPAATMNAPKQTALPFRLIVIGIISFLTLVDLFAAQAILPSLTKAYGVTPAQMGFAVNASTLGMAAAGIVMAFLASKINRRQGIWISLALLAVPTTLLGMMPDLATFTALRVVQGVFMASAFTLTMAYLAEQYSASEVASALAAYVTGNVACNLFGRLMSASLASSFGLEVNFYVFAALNLAGALLVFFALKQMAPMNDTMAKSPFAAWIEHFKNPPLRAAFGLGFLILFVFLGTFTYVNFVLAREPIAVAPMTLGLVYFVFLPSVFTTPLAGRAAVRFGSRPTFVASFAVAAAGLPLMLVLALPFVLAGLALVAVGTFFAQAAATGYVSRTATTERGAASGIYLASYYLGGLAGSAVLGTVFDMFGWSETIVALAVALALAALLTLQIKDPR